MSMQISYVKDYLKWLEINTKEVKLKSGTVRITTPFLDNNSDCTEFYVVKDGDNLRLTDDSQTITDLKLSGVDMRKAGKRQEILNNILISYGVSLIDGEELSIVCDYNSFAQSQHSLLQCILKINDLFYLASNNIKTLFNEDVRAFLEENQVRFTDDVSFQGKSLLYTNYDYSIPKSTKYPERLIKVCNKLDVSFVGSTIFAWNDTKPCRKYPSELITIINDRDKEINDSNLNALRQYDILPVKWSERDLFKERLAG